jgi:hypothetical protein
MDIMDLYIGWRKGHLSVGVLTCNVPAFRNIVSLEVTDTIPSFNCIIVTYVPLCVIVLFFVLFVYECVLGNSHRDIGALFDYTN